MSRKPLIGINTDFCPAKKGTPAVSFVFAGYFDAILKAGGVPILIPAFAEDKHFDSNIEQVLDMLDGVVMVGGADLDPRRDGYMLHPSARLLDERREVFDRFLIDKIADMRLPLLAIGTGMQLLNVSQGGTLFLHLPEDIPAAMPHRDTMASCHRHALMIERGSIMERVYGENEVRVNSMHHQAVDDVAAGFVVTARCPHGVIEAIESIHDDWFALGTQFHPEDATATAMDIGVFHEFIAGVVTRKKALGHEVIEPVFAFV
ncbi:MAG: gamma-glutamyl-gamma-aminobutyrate hydrolase family protein [Thermoguttaceae bacterium]